MISEKAFNALRILNFNCMGNEEWGVVEDSNKNIFASGHDFELKGKWLYIYLPKGYTGEDFPDPDQMVYEDSLVLLYEF